MSQRGQIKTGRPSRAFDALLTSLVSVVGIGFFTACCLVAAVLCRLAKVQADVLFVEFVGWNLLLAWIPLVLAYALSWAAERRSARAALPMLALAWIVFLPNAPYLVTDLVHLHPSFNAPSLITFSLLAFTGVLIGVRSVQLAQRAVESLWGVAAGRRAVQVIALLAGFGVYVGRVLRWNSWTIILHPRELVHVVARSVDRIPAEPGYASVRLLGIVVFAGGFYLTYRLFTNARTEAARVGPASVRSGAKS
jgi:uncharacterized membrane protein